MAARAGLTRAQRTQLRRFHRALQDEHIPVEKLILYGSRARRQAHSWSDIDVCVVSRIFGRDRHAELVRIGRIAGRIDTRIEPMPYHPGDLREKWDPLAAEIRKHGVIIR